MFTVDMSMLGSRYLDIRSGRAGASAPGGKQRHLSQPFLYLRLAWGVVLIGRPHLGNIAPVRGAGPSMEDFFVWMQGPWS